ncbi:MULTISPECIES: LpqB family beta-propeller domain-containing protein [unclassified Streptomyces]|uniref:LpqB family beta-propeller domain-containing protein n=1 Tax=unclassified Streptomyces TaxID=2593676 RepID=UPI0007F452C2|nr:MULTISPECIES: LpqB family beta-propeller domain-containing protein [unclassified Streptomyces]MCM1972714.1 LpqB family beta-propeller domain-containing protein [Streptomyces sp. G1]SBT94046.1 Sporulation and spore germination [Streptomyces sp. DI166]
MGADRDGGTRRRPRRAVAFAACGVVLLAGCASMPDSGDLSGVDSTPGQDTLVQVFAVPPPEDATPTQLVQGFLEALTSDDPNYEMASQYLTEDAAKAWRPKAGTTVLADGPDAFEVSKQRGPEETGETTFALSGTKVATVDEQQSYAPAEGGYEALLHLSRDPKTKQWRIDKLPQGVVMGQGDFERNYTAVNKYFFASNGATGSSRQPAAVADPVYVRERVDPMTQMVRSLLKGPTSLLRPVVRTAFPTGTALAKGVTTLMPDEQNKLTVPLNDKAARVGLNKCTEMAAQLLFTLRSLSPSIEEVALESGDRQLCSLTEGPEAAAARGVTEQAEHLYFIDEEHRLVRMAAQEGSRTPEAVPGALGEGQTQLRAAAVSRDEQMGAGVSRDGKQLFVGSLVSGGSLGEPVLRSAGKSEGDRLTTPSWDAQHNLWIADRNPDDPRLLLLENGAGKPLEVRTPGLDGRIESVRVAADGVRIALVVAKGDTSSLYIGRIEREAKPGEDRPIVSVMELRSATPGLEEVTTVSWAGDSRLVVVGREPNGVQTLRYVQADGSTPEGPAPAALTGVKAIAATENDQVPLVAYSEDGIVRLHSGGQWQKVVTDGTAPVYPG